MLCAAVVLIGTSFWPAIYNETEGQYAGAAHEMVESGSWLVPTNDGIPRLQKPPVVYWLIKISMLVFGKNEFAARLPNALASLGWIFVLYLTGRRIGGPTLGLFAAAIFSSMFGVFIFSHLIMPEPFLGLCLSLTFWSLISAWQEPEHAKRWFLRAWIFMGLGTMVKGLHGALLPLAVVGVTALFNRGTRHFWRRLFSWRRLLILLAMVIPWYVIIEVKFPGFLKDQFINEQIGHLIDKRWPPDCERVPLGIWAGQHLVFFFPWILFAPAAIRAWRQKPNSTGDPSAAAVLRRVDRIPARMLWIFVLLTLTAVLFSSRQDYYTFITWGAIAIGLALPWVSSQSRGYFCIPCALIGGIGAALLVGSYLVTPAVLQSSASVVPNAARTDLFSSVTGFSAGAWQGYLDLFQWTGLAFLVAGAVGVWLIMRGKIPATGLFLAALMVVPYLSTIRAFTLAEDFFSLEKAGRAIETLANEDAMVVCEGEPHFNASILFYVNRPIYWVGARPDGDFVQRALHIGRELYLTEAQLIQNWRSSRKVLFIVEKSNLPGWQKKFGASTAQMTPLSDNGNRVVIANH
jgi:hypothetical protein